MRLRATPRILRLVKLVDSLEEFYMNLKKWPKWYLETDELKRATKYDLEKLYVELKVALANKRKAV